jgi:predicted amidophosphoribosyltransferase
LEGTTAELAQEFVDHKMGLNCVKSEPLCPICRMALKTWHATGCWGCGWRRDVNRQLTDYY